ncbi:MAG TPA: histidinol dehydrogenase [Terriglobales bacterium]|nr:histidinol dehydrogenase [Terriglobales bacterium]
MLRPVALHDLTKLSAPERAALLIRAEEDLSLYVERVKPILAAVKAEGDAALVRFAQQFDKAPANFTAASLKVGKADIDAAFKTVSPEVIAAIEFAADNIRRYHQAQMPEEMWMKEIQPGVMTGERWNAIDSCACYIPRGKGSFPSMVTMSLIPAVVAGVPRLIVLTPPGPDGKADAATLVAARISGVEEIYLVGGSQAIAAAAYGTATVPKVHKIVGPSNSYGVAAKRLLSDVIDPGFMAGPSESIIIADETADGRLAALDLLIEAEHGPDSSAFLVTNSRKVAEAAIAAIPDFYKQMSETRVSYCDEVLSGKRGGVVLAPDLQGVFDFVNDYAPEHLMVHAKEPFEHLGKIRNAGEILLGAETPNTLGNYVLGPNAILPTSGAARTASPLSVFDYLKRTSLAYVTPKGYPQMAKPAKALADYEGFDAHANAVSDLRQQVVQGKR